MKQEEMRRLIGASTLSKRRNGNYLARWPFFYTHGQTLDGQTLDKKANQVVKALPQAVVVNHDCVLKNFNGGASVANQSHFSVEFKIVTKIE